MNKTVNNQLRNENKREFRFEVRISGQEKKLLEKYITETGLNRSDIIREYIAGNNNNHLINIKKLLLSLDKAGTEMGRIGNNINQIARFANTLLKLGNPSVELLSEFNRLFSMYISQQRMLEKLLRQVLRDNFKRTQHGP